MTHDEQRKQLRKMLAKEAASICGCDRITVHFSDADRLIDLLDPLVVMKDENQENLIVEFSDDDPIVDKDVIRTFRVKE